MNDLITLPENDKAMSVFLADKGLDPYLQEIKDEIESFVPDISSPKGRKEVASFANKIARSKTALDSIGKELVAKLKEQPKLIDAERKRMRDLLDKWKEEVRAPLTEFEDKEKARIAKLEESVNEIQEMGFSEGLSAVEIKERIDTVKAIVIDESWQEFEGKAAGQQMAALRILEEALAKQEKYEAEQAELEKLRKEQAEREQREREERIAREAEERARIEAEAKAKAEREAVAKREQEAKEKAEREALEHKLAIERAEKEKIEAEQRAERAEKEATEKAKREHEEAQRREQEEIAKREANKKHKAKINNEAVSALVKSGTVDESKAKEIVTLIAKGEITNVKINY